MGRSYDAGYDAGVPWTRINQYTPHGPSRSDRPMGMSESLPIATIKRSIQRDLGDDEDSENHSTAVSQYLHTTPVTMSSRGDVIAAGERINALQRAIKNLEDQHEGMMRSRDGALENMKHFSAEAEAAGNSNSADFNDAMNKYWIARRLHDIAQDAGIKNAQERTQLREEMRQIRRDLQDAGRS